MRFGILFFVAFAAGLPGDAMAGRVAVQVASCATVKDIVHAIHSETNRDSRIDLALQLAAFVKKRPNCGASAHIVDKIAKLLGDRVDGVREGAAMALADIGPPAIRAVSALKKAAQRSDRILDASSSTLLPVDSSGDAARDALRKITGEPVPDYPTPVP